MDEDNHILQQLRRKINVSYYANFKKLIKINCIIATLKATESNYYSIRNRQNVLEVFRMYCGGNTYKNH